MHLNKERRDKGQGAPQAVEVINLWLVTDCNTSKYRLWIEEKGKVLISNEVRFNEGLFPRRNRQMIDDHLTNLADIDVVSLDRGGMRQVTFDSLVDLNDFEKVHSGGSSDSYFLRSLSDPNLYMGVRREDLF